MTDLVPRGIDAVAGRRDAELWGPRLPRTVQRAVDMQSARGLVGAARVQAASFVAQVAIHNLELLSHYEATASASDPVAASRYTGIVEDFLLVARSEMRRMARDL